MGRQRPGFNEAGEFATGVGGAGSGSWRVDQAANRWSAKALERAIPSGVRRTDSDLPLGSEIKP